MKKTYFTVGPTQLFPSLEKHIKSAIKENIGSLNHRGEDFEDLYRQTKSNLQKLLGIPKSYEIFFVSSGNEAMERILENTVEEESFHVITGDFSQKFFDFAKLLKKNPKKVIAKEGDGLSFEELNISKSAELICFTQNETSSGVWIPEKTIADAKRQNPATLVAVDIVSSVPQVNLDYNKTDCVFFSVQKGFGLPPGLGVLIVSPEAMEKSYYLEKKGNSIGTYHNFLTLKRYADMYQTPETPSVLHIYLFNKVIKDMLKIGIKKIRKQTLSKAELLYNFFDKHPFFKPFILDKTFRSPTIIIPVTGSKTKIVKKKLEKHGFIVGNGYGKYKESQIRIANFHAHPEKDIRKLIAILKQVK
jgi:phosphoserine aminotransferase